MKEQIQIIQSISFLYELSLATGKSLDFNENCHQFLKVLMARKSLTFASIWLSNDFLEDKKGTEQFTLAYANPKTKTVETSITTAHPMCQRLLKEKIFSVNSNDKDFKDYIQETISPVGTYAILTLGDIGFIKTYAIHKKNHYDKQELFQLRNVMEKFGASIRACFIHSRLQKAKVLQEQRELEKQKLVEELEFTNQELKDFAYIVSHDLKAPLRAIRSLAGWLAEDYKDVLDEDGQEQLDLLQSRVVRMHNFIEGILEYSRVGRLKEKWEDIDLSKSINQIIDFIQPPSHFEIKTPEPLPVVNGERVRIEQVFMNLISNGIKYNDKEKGVITIRWEDQGDFVYFEIEDNGIGIKEKYFQKIFQLFQTLQSGEEVESTGIGLTIVKKVIELHGGNISVRSVVGESTTMCFTLPKGKE